MKYGIRDGILREPLETLFTVAKNIGFDGIEYCIGGDYKDSLLWQEGGLEKLKALADKDGMEISSLSPGVFSSLSPVVPDVEKRAEGREMLTRVIEMCPPLDTDSILVPMFPRDVADWTEGTWKTLVDGLKPLAEVAEKHKVFLDLETTFNADQLLMVIDKIGSPYVKVYYDVGNCTNRGFDVPAEMRQLGDQMGMIHIKEAGGDLLGEGKVDFKGVSDAIRDTGYDGYLVLETRAGDDPKAAAAHNLAFTKKLGK
jgi:sugar phosphate isomerase/epimerase